ncbi:unnamed protein product [Effrenium voratum]|nr:unnamed protein product [Effrenium voratum]
MKFHSVFADRVRFRRKSREPWLSARTSLMAAHSNRAPLPPVAAHEAPAGGWLAASQRAERFPEEPSVPSVHQPAAPPPGFATTRAPFPALHEEPRPTLASLREEAGDALGEEELKEILKALDAGSRPNSEAGGDAGNVDVINVDSDSLEEDAEEEEEEEEDEEDEESEERADELESME